MDDLRIAEIPDRDYLRRCIEDGDRFYCKVAHASLRAEITGGQALAWYDEQDRPVLLCHMFGNRFQITTDRREYYRFQVAVLPEQVEDEVERLMAKFGGQETPDQVEREVESLMGRLRELMAEMKKARSGDGGTT